MMVTLLWIAVLLLIISGRNISGLIVTKYPLNRRQHGCCLPSQSHHALATTFQETKPNGGRHETSTTMTTLQLSPDAILLAETLAPKMGVMTSTGLYLAPAAAVFAARKANDIGQLNPIPLAVMSIVSVAWLAYGLTAYDPYVAICNLGGSVISALYVLTILPLLQNNPKTLRRTQTVLLAGMTTSLCLWTTLAFWSHDPWSTSNKFLSRTKIKSILGSFATGLFLVFSGSPLSTINDVIKTQDSASILGSITIVQVVNTSLWSAYGFAIKDRFLWGPNIIGLGLGLVQLVLKLIFPSSKQRKKTILGNDTTATSST